MAFRDELLDNGAGMSRPSGILDMPGTVVGVRTEWDKDKHVPDRGVDRERGPSSHPKSRDSYPRTISRRDGRAHNNEERELVNGSMDALLSRKNRLAGLTGLSAGSTRTLLVWGACIANFADFASVAADFSSSFRENRELVVKDGASAQEVEAVAATNSTKSSLNLRV
ncbi:hypothetical protein K435DRAFT_867580 [Dendrothele bispora CBS 962.96]|uniref:Uncharacterized protein n=1 Tax=Dendrothele bispora (strain CBS 962.96) TaxID=1314807 RepID=A0A4S8LDW0_DENBC|nr:hypothetical protein K435DRAFT_867580 [Dendrothele bispora CBS 962.96]